MRLFYGHTLDSGSSRVYQEQTAWVRNPDLDGPTIDKPAVEQWYFLSVPDGHKEQSLYVQVYSEPSEARSEYEARKRLGYSMLLWNPAIGQWEQPSQAAQGMACGGRCGGCRKSQRH